MSEDFLRGNWVLDSYVQYAQNRQETVVPGGIRTDLLPIAMDVVTGPSGQPVCRVTLFISGPFDDCVPINLIGGNASVTPEAADYVLDNGKIARGRTTENDAEVTLRGDLTQGGDVLGPITAAFGASWRQQTLGVRTIDPCDEFPCTASGVRLSDLGLMSPDLRGVLPETDPVNGIPGLRFVPPGFAGDANSSTVLFSSQRAVEGGYTVREAFFEFGIPLLENGKLNLNEAFRWADYSGSGSTNAWKTGISYQATDWLRLRATRESHARSKNGHPPQSTTGADSTSWMHRLVLGPIPATSAGASISPEARANTGAVRARLTQNRRAMSTSSALGPSSALISSGSRAIPHFGQAPGPLWRTSGCIGHV